MFAFGIFKYYFISLEDIMRGVFLVPWMEHALLWPLACLILRYTQLDKFQFADATVNSLYPIIYTHTHTHMPLFYSLFAVFGSCPEILQLLLHLHVCAGSSAQTHCLRRPSLLQRQVQCLFLLFVIKTWYCLKPSSCLSVIVLICSSVFE